MNRLVLVALLAAVGCATGGVEILPIKYDSVDNIPERRIEVSFTNEFGYPVCLQPETWPNMYGVIDHGADRVNLIIDGRRFTIADVNMGYCLGRDCETVVAPGEMVSAFFRYDDFGLPEELIESAKQLEFNTYTYRCRPKRETE